jgi:hypothetical protein
MSVERESAIPESAIAISAIGSQHCADYQSPIANPTNLQSAIAIRQLPNA